MGDNYKIVSPPSEKGPSVKGKIEQIPFQKEIGVQKSKQEVT